MIEIKRLDGTTVLTLPDVPEDAKVHRELGGDHYVTLSFTTEEPIYFRLGDYVELQDFGRFELIEPYTPTHNSDTDGYDYTLQLEAYYMKWKNKIVRYMPSASASETSFHLTAAVEIHLNVIVNGINALGEKDSNYLYEGQKFCYQLSNFPSDTVSTAKYKEYNNTDFISALDDLASTFECEWWVEGSIIYFGKCELDTVEIDMELNTNVEEMSGSESSSDYATRILFFGSDRNLPSDYRKNSSADITQNGVVQKRLMLPLTGEHACPNGYIQDGEVTNETGAIELVVVDEDIYPRTTCKVERIETYTSTYTDEETDEKKTKTYYRLYDGSGFNFNTDMILEGETLHILFQSGEMNGMDFECSFDDGEKYYEVVVNEDYGRELPDTSLHPEVGDEFVLYGWDSTKIGSTGLIEAAEEELYQAALYKLAELKIDPNTYTCTMMSDWYAEKMRTESFTMWSLGQPVVLKNPSFPSGSRSSRIIGYEIKLDIPYDTPEYIVGESAAYSRTKTMEQEIESLTVNGETYQSKNGLGKGVFVIASTSTTPASDYNVYSAARSDKNFLRKNKNDNAQGVITFEQGLVFGENENGKIDASANAELLNLVVRQLISSARFVSGFDGEGYQLWIDNTGLANLEVDKLTVRQIMTVFELIINKIRAVGGQIVVSAANGKIKGVEESGETYKITFEGDNYFAEHDLMRCQTFTGNDLRSYWVEVKSVGTDYVEVSKDEFSYGNEPKEGDEVVLMGNTTNTKRQNLITISATEDGEPRVDVLDGVKAKNFTGALRARLGNLDGITDSSFPTTNQPQGNGLYADNAYLKGTFLLSTGEDVKTLLEATEGKITSAIEGVRNDIASDKSYLSNPTFAEGMEKWDTANKATFFLAGNKWILANDTTLTKKGNGAWVVKDDERTAVQIRSSYIMQKNENLHYIPTFEPNSEGKKVAIPVYVSFFYKCITPGSLVVNFLNVDKTGFEDFTSLAVIKSIDQATDGYVQYSCSGYWNGTGDFHLLFSGEINIYMLVLSTDPVDNLTNKYKTLFEQSEKLVQISAAVYDKDQKALQETGLLIKADQAGLYAQNDKGDVSTIGVYVESDETKIKLTGSNIMLEGEITANGNVNILEDGSIVAKNGCFYGFVKKNVCTITADNIDTYGTTDTGTGYVTLDFTKTGSMIEFSGNLKTKIGSHNELVLILVHCASGGGTTEALTYLDQKIVVINNSDVTVAVNREATNNITPSGTPTVEPKYLMVLEPEFVLTNTSSQTLAKYAMLWNVYIAQQ